MSDHYERRQARNDHEAAAMVRLVLRYGPVALGLVVGITLGDVLGIGYAFLAVAAAVLGAAIVGVML